MSRTDPIQAVVKRLLGDSRGAVSVEYLILFACIGLPLAAGLLGLIPRIVAHYANQQAILYLPYP